MTKFILTSILALVLLGAVHASAEKDVELKFANDFLNSQLSYADPYILQILKEHEKAFPGAIRYSALFFPTNLNRLSKIQQSVLLTLHNETDFAKQWQAKKELITIDATVTNENSKTKAKELRMLDQNEWSWERSKIASVVTYALSRSNSDRKSLLKELAELSESRILRAKYYRRGDFVHREAQYTVAALVISGMILKEGEDFRPSDLAYKVRSIGLGALDYLHDPLAYKPLLEQLTIADQAETFVKAAYQGITEAIYKDKVAVRMEPGLSLQIREVHPNIAIFRGYVGNDCSTSYSPGFVFTPKDRYYYIFDEIGKSLGYLGLTLVTIEKKPAAFIHTIQGPDLTHAQTELVMRAMVLAAPQIFDTDMVVLGPDESITSNVNFMAISDTMQNAVAGIKSVPMKYGDEKIRNIIANFDSTLTYDDPRRNHSGRKLDFKQPGLVEARITKQEFDARFLRPRIKQPNVFDRCEDSLTRR
jgi:hypothetical protein